MKMMYGLRSDTALAETEKYKTQITKLNDKMYLIYRYSNVHCLIVQDRSVFKPKLICNKYQNVLISQNMSRS